jgi:hypothetical protein
MSATLDSLAPGSLVGLTTSVPIEVILAAGHRAVDLNNVFITAPDPYGLVAEAEEEGFARSLAQLFAPRG